MGDNKERMLRGELYIADDPDLLADYHRGRQLVERFNALSVTDEEAGRRLLEELLGALRRGLTDQSPLPVRLRVPDRGRGAHLHQLRRLDPRLREGHDRRRGADRHQRPAAHGHPPARRRRTPRGWESAQPITIEDGVWLGGGVIVCPGVTIGENTVVGAGGVVVKDLPPGVLAVGNPARPIREL